MCSDFALAFKHLAAAAPIVTLIIAIAWVKVARARAKAHDAGRI